MTARASRRETEIGAPLAFRTFAFEWEHHPGFSRSVYVRLWKLNLTLSSYPRLARCPQRGGYE